MPAPAVMRSRRRRSSDAVHLVKDLRALRADAYAKLPAEFMGFSRSKIAPVGGSRRGVVRLSDFLAEKTGSTSGELTAGEWLSVPEQALAEATNGRLFLDPYGEVTRIRENLHFYPEDVRLKRLAGHLLLMAQSGQYNYRRCLGHGETGAAQLAAGEFARSTLSVIFLLNRRYQPFYKWSFRALRGLPELSELSVPLERLISTGNDPALAEEKAGLIEEIAQSVSLCLAEQGLIPVADAELERCAYVLNDRIGDHELRNLHILAAV